jgi:uncharacterized DUF497 family protein
VLLFEWDPRKAAVNERKHGVSFAEASTVFGDPSSFTIADPDHSENEERWILVGVSHRNRLLVIAHADFGDSIRIISARPANRKERRGYETG